MRKLKSQLFCCLLCLYLPTALIGYSQKRMAITIDDLPTVSRYYVTPDAQAKLTQKLLAHCTRFRVPAIGFVIGKPLLQPNGKADSSRIKLITVWLDAGLELGNHTFAHKDYNLVSFEEMKADIISGEQNVKKLATQRNKPFRYFRHPFLRKGETQAKKDSLEAFLKQRGYQEAPVTIDNSDWLFSSAYDNALLLGDTALASQVGNQYVDYMDNCVAYYEAQSDSLFGRQIAHSLLIHANAINADYLGTLLTRLQQRNYGFVSLSEVLKDTAYNSEDRFYGKGGISWLHRWALTKGKKGAFFKGEPQVPAMIEELANRKL